MTTRANFFVPGPTWVRPEILQTMTRPMIGHRGPEFRDLFRRITPRLQALFRTSNPAFFAASTGTGLMEGSLSNTVPRTVLVTTCGAFSERWLKIAHKLGLEADQLEFAWGEAVDPVRLADHLVGRRHHHYDAVTITHNETSTGVINDVAALVQAVRSVSEDTLVVVDAVSSLACAPVLVDEWGVDVCFASCQKGLALPPGLTVFTVSPRALAAAERKHYKGTYFNFLDFHRSAEKESVPFTPAVSLVYGLDQQLEDIEKEGLEARWERHRALRDRTLERTAGWADPASDPSALSPSVSALMPERVTARELLAKMKERGYTIGGGYGHWSESTFRVGHMGDITLADLDAMLDVMEEVAGS